VPEVGGGQCAEFGRRKEVRRRESDALEGEFHTARRDDGILRTRRRDAGAIVAPSRILQRPLIALVLAQDGAGIDLGWDLLRASLQGREQTGGKSETRREP
jgi:hypothetical protein